jgi:ketosteroid isomerase-like protein
MSHENVETARRLFPAFNSRDIATLVELLDPDVEWVPIMAVREGRVYRGHEGVKRWIEDLEEYWELFEMEAEEFRDLGDRVLALGCWRARGRVSGVGLGNEPGTWLTHFRAGKVVRMQTFTDRAEGLEAAGMSERDALS